MRYALPDIHRLYRNPDPAAHPNAPLRISHPLGNVWYAGEDRVLTPTPATLSAPWCQLGVVPEEQTDGVEDRLIVCDASLAQHKLAWRVMAPANEGNVFLRVARQLWLVPRVHTLFPGVIVLIAGNLCDPFGSARFVPQCITLDGERLDPTEAGQVLKQLGVDTS